MELGPESLAVTWKVEELNRRLLRARDAMDRAYAEPLDIRVVAAVACLSEAHFIRSFRACFEGLSGSRTRSLESRLREPYFTI